MTNTKTVEVKKNKSRKRKIITEKRTPPSETVKSVQYDLFKSFIANDDTDVSNTIERWESIPKYFFTPAQMDKLRTEKGHADPYEWNYSYNGRSYTVEIQPALIKQKEGGYKAFFPGVTEELLEEALKKIFADQQLGIHDPEKVESWVRFSLSMLQKELKSRGKERNRPEIRHAIEVMSKCIITVYQSGKEIYTGAILSDLVGVDRDDYLEDPNAHWIARLPVFISQSINSLQYRQFNYGRLMGCTDQLSRWIYKRLINRFKQASITNAYNFMFSDIAQNSGLLQQGNDRRNRAKVITALDQLKKEGVLSSYVTEERKLGRKIENVKYILTPSKHFISEQKASNKRESDAQKNLLETSLT